MGDSSTTTFSLGFLITNLTFFVCGELPAESQEGCDDGVLIEDKESELTLSALRLSSISAAIGCCRFDCGIMVFVVVVAVVGSFGAGKQLGLTDGQGGLNI